MLILHMFSPSYHHHCYFSRPGAQHLLLGHMFLMNSSSFFCFKPPPRTKTKLYELPVTDTAHLQLNMMLQQHPPVACPHLNWEEQDGGSKKLASRFNDVSVFLELDPFHFHIILN